MKVLIVGAGISGLTLAYWLHKYGHQPIVIEKAPDIRTEGYAIDFTGTGWDVAQRMGIIPKLESHKLPIDSIIYKKPAGQTAARVPFNTLFRAANVENKYMGLNRRDLVVTLYETVRDAVEVRFGMSVKQICESLTGTTVTFTDNTEATFDMIVGADGIHSQVRELAFGAEDQFAHYLGYQFGVFVIPALPHKLENAYYMYVEPNQQVGIYPINADEWMIFVVYRSESPAKPKPEERATMLHQRYVDSNWIVPDIMALLKPDTYVFLDTVTQIQMPAWSHNHVVLIGDAAYCPTLISGQGASMAMAGAYYLAQGIRDNNAYDAAMRYYEKRLRDHIQTIQMKAQNFAPNFVPSSRFQITLIGWVMRMMGLPFVANIVGKQFSVESILESA